MPVAVALDTGWPATSDPKAPPVLHRLAFAVLLLAGALPANANSLRDAFEAAVALNPELRGLEAQKAVIEARHRGANALTPGAPSVGLGYTSDRFTQNRGFKEAEVEFGMPVWLPGQARAQQGLADAESRRLGAQIAARRLVVAGEVRDAYWAWAMAEAVLTAARARAGASGALARDVARQARGGQLSRAEDLLAGAGAREDEVGLREAEAILRDARLAFRALTGRDPLPGWRDDVREAEAPAEHPRLTAARLGIDVARAGARVTTVEDRESPEVGIFMRQEESERGGGWDTRLGVRVRIPFAHPPRNAERRAAANGELATATAETGAAERALSAERDRARAALADARLAVRLTEQRYSALAQAAGLGERALREGQASLAETLRSRAGVAAADAARRQAQVALRQAASRYNQALGVEP